MSISRLHLQTLAKGKFAIAFYHLGKGIDTLMEGYPDQDIAPNKQSLIPERRKELAYMLLLEFKRALEKGWRPQIQGELEAPRMLRDAMKRYIPAAHLTEKYRQELAKTHASFLSFLTRNRLLDRNVIDLTTSMDEVLF